MGHTIKWGEIPLGRELNDADIKMLKEKLEKKARGCNSFFIYLVPEAVKFVKEKISNAYIIDVMADGDGTQWCAVGANKESAEHLFSTI